MEHAAVLAAGAGGAAAGIPREQPCTGSASLCGRQGHATWGLGCQLWVLSLNKHPENLLSTTWRVLAPGPLPGPNAGAWRGPAGRAAVPSFSGLCTVVYAASRAFALEITFCLTFG